MNGLFASLIIREYLADVRMFDRVICGCLSAATSANYPLQHPQIRILPRALRKLHPYTTHAHFHCFPNANPKSILTMMLTLTLLPNLHCAIFTLSIFRRNRNFRKEVVIRTYVSANIIWCYSHLRVLIFYDHLHVTLVSFFLLCPQKT